MKDSYHSIPLPERNRGADLTAYRRAIDFLDEGVRIRSMSAADNDVGFDSPFRAQDYFTIPWTDTEPPIYPDWWRPDDWPQIVLICASVIEVQPEGVAAFGELVDRHRLPAGVAVSRTREGMTQFWFLTPGGFNVAPANTLPPGVGIKLSYRANGAWTSAATPAPIKFPKDLPRRIYELELPEMPHWLLSRCGIYYSTR